MGGDGQGDKPLVRFDVEDGIGVITIDNPPVNALRPGVPEGIVEAVERGNADPAVKAMVLIGAGRSFIAGADIRQFGTAGRRRCRPAHAPRRARREPQAGGRGDPRLCAGRRAGDRARLPLPDRRAERQGRPARGVDRHPAGQRRHPAAAAADRPEGGDGDDRLGPPRPGRGGARRSASSTNRARQSDLRKAAIALARRVADTRPLPRIRDHDDKLAEAKADPGMFEAMRKSIARRARNQKAPYNCIAAVEAACTHAVRRRASGASASCSTSSKIPPRRGRCAMPSSPSARSPNCPTSRATRRCARSRPRRSSAPARWAAALR